MNKIIYTMKPSQLFILLSVCSMFLTISVGWTLGNGQAKNLSPLTRQALAHVPTSLMAEVLNMQIPYLRQIKEIRDDQPLPFSLFLFESITQLQPSDLRTLLGRELPGLSQFNTEVIALGQNVTLPDLVVESGPPSETLPIVEEEPTQAVPSNPTDRPAVPETNLPTVLVYNTHNEESWTHVSDHPSVTHETTNISLVSKKLTEELNRRGVRSTFDDTNYQKILKDNGLPYAFSYAQSLKSIQSVMKQDGNIQYLFDIHRDSKPKKTTTAEINGKSYARIIFVIGKQNPNWEQNAEFAKKLHYLMEKKYPGLSIGVLGKREGNGEYNQSTSPQNLLVEIGGIENTMEENYNATAALADVIADVYFEKEQKVDAPTESEQKPL